MLKQHTPGPPSYRGLGKVQRGFIRITSHRLGCIGGEGHCRNVVWVPDTYDTFEWDGSAYCNGHVPREGR